MPVLARTTLLVSRASLTLVNILLSEWMFVSQCVNFLSYKYLSITRLVFVVLGIGWGGGVLVLYLRLRTAFVLSTEPC